MPSENNGAADSCLATSIFETTGEHTDVGKQDGEHLSWPFAVGGTDNQLRVADTGNHRIVFYTI